MDPTQDRYAVEKANQYISYLVSHELQLEIADRVQYRPFIAALNNTGGIFKIIEDKCKIAIVHGGSDDPGRAPNKSISYIVVVWKPSSPILPLNLIFLPDFVFLQILIF